MQTHTHTHTWQAFNLHVVALGRYTIIIIRIIRVIISSAFFSKLHSVIRNKESGWI